MSSYFSTDVDHVGVRVVERQENPAARIHLFYFQWLSQVFLQLKQKLILLYAYWFKVFVAGMLLP